MKRSTFNLFATIIWIGIIVIGAAFWREIWAFFETMPQNLGRYVGPFLVLVAVLLGIFIHDRLADAIAPRKIDWQEDMSEEEKREHFRREALQAEKQGRVGAAMLLYEEGGMYNRALQLAEQLDDKPGLARLSCKLGHYSRARRIYLRLKDYEAAGHTSVLMKEIDTAREYYRQAAEACQGKVDPALEAGLWERAGERETAAKLYEEAVQLERAAECYRLMGRMEDAVRCSEEAKVMESFELRQRGENRRQAALRADREKAAAAGQAKELESQGDYLGAGLLYRKAGQPMEAARAFEAFEEWERAADCYEEAGQKDRAELARMHVEKPEAEISAVPPQPTDAASAQFVPISRAPAIPVHIAATGEIPGSPQARLEVCKRVRRGNFLEAAEFAKATGDWIMAAAYYEHAANYIAAADVYRQIGDTSAAAWCLDKAGRPREAAFLMLAVGQNDRAVFFFLNALEQDDHVAETGFTLGELLIQWRKPALALELLLKKIAPSIVDEASAQLHYRFARRFEELKAWKEADTIYQGLVRAGVRAEQVAQSAKRVAVLAGESRRVEAEGKPKAEAAEPDQIDSLVREYLDKLPEEPGPAEEAAEALGQTRLFQFAPDGGVISDDQAPVEGKTFLFEPQEFSLFGRSIGEEEPSAHFDSNGELIVDGAALSRGDADPFKPGQRYEKKAELGRGGMGVVYEALDTVLGRRVALKLILEHLANAGAYERFLIEARAIAVLSHPNVIIIFDIGLMDLQHYIAMEFADGGSVGKLVEKEKALPLDEALRIFIETARGLQAAHRAGVVHCDIKPDNLLLTSERQVKIGDFGLATVKRKADGRDEGEIFQASGTPGFIAPEQYRGADATPAFDIYSLGITLFTMLVGRPPYELANKSTLREIVRFQKSGEIIPLRRFRPNVPEAIEQIYKYCAAPDPNERYKSIDAFLPTVEEIYESLDQPVVHK